MLDYKKFIEMDEWAKRYKEAEEKYKPLSVLAKKWAYESGLGNDYVAKQVYAFTLTKLISSLEDLEAAFDEIRNDYLNITSRDFSKEPGYLTIDMVTREY